MSRLSELIEALCPDGVEYKPLWAVTAWDKRFQGVPRERQGTIINYNVLLANDLFALKQDEGDVFLLSTGSETGWTTEELAGSNMHEGEVVSIPWGKAGTVNVKSVIKYHNGKFVTGDNRIMTSLDKEVLDNRFLFYVIIGPKGIDNSFYRGSGIRHPDMRKVLDLRIPIPPLEVQREIIRVLDQFTLLSTELLTELSAELRTRQKQYEYYRDNLLSFNESGGMIRKVKLKDIGTFTRGKRFVKADSVDDGYPCIHYGELYTHYGVWANEVESHIDYNIAKKLRYAKRNDVVIVGAGENDWDIGVGVAWLGDNMPAIHDACYIFEHNQNPKYISYCLRTSDYHRQIKKYVSRGKICAISADGIGQAEIYLPTIDVQDKIVDILDKLEALTNDISEILPAEMETRQKQYEYYRDKILTFKEKVS